MQDQGSVTLVLREVRDGDDEAVGKLWLRYFERLADIARRHLPKGPTLVEDEEDVALKALQSFVVGHRQGRFGELKGRDQFWKLLALIATRKAQNVIRHEKAKKRGGGEVKSGSILSRVFAEEPTSQDMAEIQDELHRLLNVVLAGRDELRRVACLMLEGFDNKEIARQSQCTVRTVQRRFELICTLWEQDVEPRLENAQI